MDETLAIFILIMTGMAMVYGLMATWMKHRRTAPALPEGAVQATRQVELLSNENAGLKGQVSRLEERIAILERIATDPSERTARAIEQLR
ncbi:MAG TPA: hypothetical protein VIT38_15625 [Allosphingosinicella sp.]|jgi:hypothetical protein